MATLSTDPPDIDLEACCLVVAHPDDEVLWFSSIVARVGQLVLCFEDCEDYPELGPGRRAVLDAYPLPGPRITGLHVPEPCTVELVDWSQPQPSQWGLVLNAHGTPAARVARYQQTYAALRAALEPRLRGTQAVFTHNPWGEYGHPDHVQVSRVVASLANELGFRVFYSSYIAGRTMPLAASALASLRHFAELPTQPALATSLQALYAAHDCWTWPADYQRFDSEAFLEELGQRKGHRSGEGFRLNCITP